MTKDVARMAGSFDSLVESIRDLRKFDVEQENLIRAMREDFARSTEDHDRELRSMVYQLEERLGTRIDISTDKLEARLNKRIDDQFLGITELVNDIPESIRRLEQIQSERNGAMNADKESRANLPKWFSVGTAIVAIIVSIASTGLVLLITHLLR